MLWAEQSNFSFGDVVGVRDFELVNDALIIGPFPHDCANVNVVSPFTTESLHCSIDFRNCTLKVIDIV